MESCPEELQREEEEYSPSQTSTTSTEMSVVDTHAVALKYEGEKAEAEEKGTKIKGYRLVTQVRGDINWLRPMHRRGKGFLKRNINITNQVSTRINITVQMVVRNWTKLVVKWIGPPPRRKKRRMSSPKQQETPRMEQNLDAKEMTVAMEAPLHDPW